MTRPRRARPGPKPSIDATRSAADRQPRDPWRVMGAQAGVEGVAFGVWAPGARAVSVVGDFNGWDAGANAMSGPGGAGTWDCFVPGLGEGAHYQYAILGADGELRRKADPFAFRLEAVPGRASIVHTLGSYPWQDGEWMSHRRNSRPNQQPMSVYEVHAGSWRRHSDGSWLTYRELADQLVPYVKAMEFTHIELLPLTEHPFTGSWGYQVDGFFAITNRFGEPGDFRYLVDRCHQAGIGVLMDWVPGHFATDSWGLARFDGTFLYEYEQRQKRVQPEWGSFAFDLGKREVREYLFANALFWLKEYHLDGLRVDAVSSMLYLDYARAAGEWTPNAHGGRENLEAIAFLQELNERVHREGDGAITIAEEATAWPGICAPASGGGLGFDFKWNMGWMHDTLSYFRHSTVQRRSHQQLLTFSLAYAFTENFILALSHDEVVYLKRSLWEKMPGGDAARLANLRVLLAYQYAHPGKQLLFMGGEFGQHGEWDHDGALEWGRLSEPGHTGIQRMVIDLNALHRREPALHRYDHEPRGFTWLDVDDGGRGVFAFVRHAAAPEEDVLCAFNLGETEWTRYSVPASLDGSYRCCFSTGDPSYGGSGAPGTGVSRAEGSSLSFPLAPFTAVFFKREPDRG